MPAPHIRPLNTSWYRRYEYLLRYLGDINYFWISSLRTMQIKGVEKKCDNSQNLKVTSFFGWNQLHLDLVSITVPTFCESSSIYRWVLFMLKSGHQHLRLILAKTVSILKLRLFANMSLIIFQKLNCLISTSIDSGTHSISGIKNLNK